jgi:hypothetical protein
LNQPRPNDEKYFYHNHYWLIVTNQSFFNRE